MENRLSQNEEAVRIGPPDYMTSLGNSVYLFYPEHSTFSIQDVEKGLPNLNRFLGSIPAPLDAHSLLVMYIARQYVSDITQARFALIHDFHECALGDIPSPFKKYFLAFKEAECKWEKHMARSFGLDWAIRDHELIKFADLMALGIEAEYHDHRNAAACRAELTDRFTLDPKVQDRSMSDYYFYQYVTRLGMAAYAKYMSMTPEQRWAIISDVLVCNTESKNMNEDNYGEEEAIGRLRGRQLASRQSYRTTPT